MKNHFIKKILFSMSFVPHFAMAQATLDSTNVTSLVKSAHKFINQSLIPVLIALAVFYVVYAVIGFIGASSDSQKKEEKKQQIFWGIIGLFVIVSIWALIAVVGRTFGIFAGGTLSV